MKNNKYKYMRRAMLSAGNTKTDKNAAYGYLTGQLSLAPSRLSGVINVCPHASKGCIGSCLNTADRGRFTATQAARINKTKYLFHNGGPGLSGLNKINPAAVENIKRDLAALERAAQRAGLKAAARLNCMSDIYPESWRDNAGLLMDQFPNITFYDYTKNYARMLEYLRHKLPKNYHLTFSRSENNWPNCVDVLKRGGNVAAVFRGSLPEIYNSFIVTAGDAHDLTFKYTPGTLLGLTAKGRAKKDTSGFVIDPGAPGLIGQIYADYIKGSRKKIYHETDAFLYWRYVSDGPRGFMHTSGRARFLDDHKAGQVAA